MCHNSFKHFDFIVHLYKLYVIIDFCCSEELEKVIEIRPWNWEENGLCFQIALNVIDSSFRTEV